MPVRSTFKANGERVRRAARLSFSEAANAAIKNGANFYALICAKDTGRLSDSARLKEEATEDNPRAVFAVGGITVRDKMVDYAEAVELGSTRADGTHVSAQPAFLPTVEFITDTIRKDAPKAFVRAFGGYSGQIYESL